MRFTWDITATDVGTAVGIFSESGVVSFQHIDTEPEHHLADISVLLRAPITHSPGALAELDEQLVEYFAGERKEFAVTFDWQLVTGFARDALQAIMHIPYGETAAYGEVAIAAGRPRAARAVGTACRRTPFSLIVPVHRVIRSDGSLGEFGGHPEVKRFLLDLEGAHYRD